MSRVARDSSEVNRIVILEFLGDNAFRDKIVFYRFAFRDKTDLERSPFRDNDY